MVGNKNNKKKLWVFGDSFTDHSYEWLPPKIKNTIVQWPDIVSKQYRLKLVNLGGYRNATYTNPQIIHSILCNLYKIKKGDSVVIGFSDPLRILTIKDKTIRGFNNSRYRKTKKQNKTKENNIDSYSSMYVENILAPNDEIIYKFYKEQLIGLTKFLKNIGCHVYVFDHHIWKNFESVAVQTKGKFIDYHWSKRGHEQMAVHVITHLFETNKVII